MSRFEFLSVLLSVVLGLAIARILGWWGELIRGRRRVRPFWPHVGWTVFVFLTMVFSWWATWEARAQALEFSFLAYLAHLLQPAAVVVVAFVLTPPVPSRGTLDLREHFFDNARWAFSLLALTAVGLVVSGWLRGAEPLATVVRGLLLVLFAALALARSEALHRLGAPVAIGLLLLLALGVRAP